LRISIRPRCEKTIPRSAGATARSALAAIRELGVTEVTVAARDPARTADLLAAAARLGTQLGIEERSLLEALTRGSAGSRALDSAARAGSVETFAGAVREFLVKDISVVRDTAAALGGTLGVLDTAIAEIQDSGR